MRAASDYSCETVQLANTNTMPIEHPGSQQSWAVRNSCGLESSRLTNIETRAALSPGALVLMLLNTAVPIQPNISMQSLRVSTRWMHCLRNVGRPTLRAYRSWQTTSVAPGSLCRHCGAKQRKAYEAREPPHYGLCCTSRSYAISVSPTHSYEVDVMVEGRNQVLDRWSPVW